MDKPYPIATSPVFAQPPMSSLFVAGVFLGLAMLANVFTSCFVDQERYYFWDYSNYWNAYVYIADLVVRHPRFALRQVIGSAWYSDYNLLPVLPLVPFRWLFGTGRLTYILAIVNTYLLPSALVIGLLTNRIMERCRLTLSLSSFPLATTSILLLHSIWVPVLRGYPDLVGVLVIGGILLYIIQQRDHSGT